VIDAAAAASVAALYGDATEVTPDDETTVFALGVSNGLCKGSGHDLIGGLCDHD